MIEVEKAFSDAVTARMLHLAQRERAERILSSLRSIFSSEKIKREEIFITIKIPCDNKKHAAHLLTLVDLTIYHLHEDGSWDYGEDNLDALTMLKIIREHSEELVRAAKEFTEKEVGKTKQIKEFLDAVEAELVGIQTP